MSALTFRRVAACALIFVTTLGPALAALGQETTDGAAVVEHVGATLPLTLEFRDDAGRLVHLGDFFADRKPVVLQLGYFGCPMLCGLVSRGLAEALRESDLRAGRDYHVVYVSIDARETPELASQKKQTYLRAYGRPDDVAGWHLLVGSPSSIHALTAAVGFQYRWIAPAKQFAHPAVIVLVDPDGRISRYLYDVRFDAPTVRAAIVDTAQAKRVATLDRILITCFRYDPRTGKYALTAMSMMRFGGALTVLVLIVTVGGALFREHRRRGMAAKSTSVQTSGIGAAA